MNIQEIQALPLAASTEELLAPSAKVAQPVELSEAEVAEAQAKAEEAERIAKYRNSKYIRDYSYLLCFAARR